MQRGTATPLQILGRGRSGVVYRSTSPDGRATAIKVFRPDGLAQLAMTILTGAPNPYRWNADAAACIVLRRRILGALVEFWFPGRLRVPETIGPRWNAAERAFEVESELIDAGHLPLIRGASEDRPESLDRLLADVMRPLQKHLREAGAVGLVWQAGLGNPVAGGNFMLEPGPAPAGDRWVWIDLESGIPALLPLNPIAMLRFYGPQMLRRRRLLFDDVDVPVLRAWVDRHRTELTAALGPERVAAVDADAVDLERHQEAWRSLSRVERSLGHAEAVGWISPDEAAHYRSRPIRWYARLAARGTAGAARAVARGGRAVASWLLRARWARFLRALGEYVVSPRFRTRLSRRYVHQRLLAWNDRRFLDPASLRRLRQQLRRDSSARDLSDFGVHLAMKPPITVIQYWILPLLFVLGTIDALALAVGALFGESIARTAYTGGRIVQSSIAGNPRPWIALLVGLIPVIGVSAFPAQMLYSGTNRERALSRFIVYDTFASIGRAVPIWGGRDSLVEHAFNRLPGVLFGRVARRPPMPASVALTAPIPPGARDVT